MSQTSQEWAVVKTIGAEFERLGISNFQDLVSKKIIVHSDFDNATYVFVCEIIRIGIERVRVFFPLAPDLEYVGVEFNTGDGTWMFILRPNYGADVVRIAAVSLA